MVVRVDQHVLVCLDGVHRNQSGESFHIATFEEQLASEGFVFAHIRDVENKHKIGVAGHVVTMLHLAFWDDISVEQGDWDALITEFNDRASR